MSAGRAGLPRHHFMRLMIASRRMAPGIRTKSHADVRRDSALARVFVPMLVDPRFLTAVPGHDPQPYRAHRVLDDATPVHHSATGETGAHRHGQRGPRSDTPRPSLMESAATGTAAAIAPWS